MSIGVPQISANYLRNIERKAQLLDRLMSDDRIADELPYLARRIGMVPMLKVLYPDRY